MDKKHIVWHDCLVNKEDRNKVNKHRSALLWFTALSASGKSTLANKLDLYFHKNCTFSYVLDGDNIRHGLNKNLGFSPEDRKENIRRIGEVGKLFVDAGLIVSTAFISPYREDRDEVRHLLDDGEFFEIYVKCPIEVCQQRDPKGNYKKAIEGIIKNYTGISAPYEEPLSPEIIVETDKFDIDACVDQIIERLKKDIVII
ncbi:adenylylsulfate kinase [Candidatus Magnetoovum chiemensis]|nr:adenylylsulfate kinase [Candidatus Magnetoovum chiemensis]